MNIKKKSYAEKRKLRRKIKMRISSFLFILMFIFWGMYYLLQSDLMNLKNIVLEGNSYVDENEIIDISSLVINRNIFKYNLKEIKKNIKSHPMLKR